MDEIRIGVFGLGHRGIHWIRVLDRIDGYRITAVGDIFPLQERALAEISNREGVESYSSYEDMLADPNIDAIALCVRCEEQGAMAARALEAGKHVNSEVPAAHTMEDLWRIVAAQEKTGLVYMLAEQMRYSGFITGWRDLVQQGRLGHVGYVEGEYFSRKSPHRYYQDPKTGEFIDIPDLANHPDAQPTWLHKMPPIHYLCHDLSAMLSILDDRVVKVTGMGTRPQSYLYDAIKKSDIQVALLHTEKDTVMRMACAWSAGRSRESRGHRYQLIASHGTLETNPHMDELQSMWLADSQMHDVARVDWRQERTDAPSPSPSEAAALAEIKPDYIGGRQTTGYSIPSIDYIVHSNFREAVLGEKPQEFDVYKAMDTAAPAILAADSIEQGSHPIDVPDFHPDDSRPSGQLPKGI